MVKQLVKADFFKSWFFCYPAASYLFTFMLSSYAENTQNPI